jgi:hypothetical protein
MFLRRSAADCANLQLRQLARTEPLHVHQQLGRLVTRLAGVGGDRTCARFADVQAGRNAAGAALRLEATRCLIVDAAFVFAHRHKLAGQHLAHQAIEHVGIA